MILDTLLLLNIKSNDKKKYNENKKLGLGHFKKVEDTIVKNEKNIEENENGFIKIYPTSVILLSIEYGFTL